MQLNSKLHAKKLILANSEKCSVYFRLIKKSALIELTLQSWQRHLHQEAVAVQRRHPHLAAMFAVAGTWIRYNQSSIHTSLTGICSLIRHKQKWKSKKLSLQAHSLQIGKNNNVHLKRAIRAPTFHFVGTPLPYQLSWISCSCIIIPPSGQAYPFRRHPSAILWETWANPVWTTCATNELNMNLNTKNHTHNMHIQSYTNKHNNIRKQIIANTNSRTHAHKWFMNTGIALKRKTQSKRNCANYHVNPLKYLNKQSQQQLFDNWLQNEA